VVGKAARDELVAAVRRAVEVGGSYVAPVVQAAPVATVAPVAPEVRQTNLETAAVAWIAYKRTRCVSGSVRRYAQHMARFFGAVRVHTGLGPKAVVTASMLSRDLLIACVRSWQTEGLSESYVYGAARSALEMWRWVSDDPVTYPGVPVPPRESKAVLPHAPLYSPPPAPTLAEVDACLRHLPIDAEQSRRIGALLRYTGLRITQVVTLRRQDLDFDARTLVVRTGKSRWEKAERRTVPVARGLLAEIAPWARDLAPEAFLFPAWGVAGAEKHASARPEVFAAAWREAVRWREAREEVWNPANRAIARPEHAFRAALQAVLAEGGASEPLLDVLVGHRGKSTRDRHYVPPDVVFARLREALDALPAVDWVGPRDKGSVISLAKARQRARPTATQSTG
jgi:integrase